MVQHSQCGCVLTDILASPKDGVEPELVSSDLLDTGYILLLSPPVAGQSLATTQLLWLGSSFWTLQDVHHGVLPTP